MTSAITIIKRPRTPATSILAIAAIVATIAPAGQTAQPDSNAGTAELEPFTQDISGSAVQFDMVPIPAGTLRRPDPENPDRLIEIDIPAFHMSATEVTWDAYDIFVFALDQADPSRPDDVDVVARPSKPYVPPDRGFGHAGYAALSMTHHAAEQFCVWLSNKTGRTYRLATQDEWEYACRAGADTTYCFGDDADRLADFAWFDQNAQWTTHAVASLEPNAFGLYDMHGNTAEWVQGRDGSPIVCGGSYLDPADAVTATSTEKPTRAWQASDPQIPRSRWWLADATHVGFRIVCENPE